MNAHPLRLPLLLLMALVVLLPTTAAATAAPASAVTPPEAATAPLLSANGVAETLTYPQFVRLAREGSLRAAVIDVADYWVAAADVDQHVVAAPVPRPTGAGVTTKSATVPSIYDLEGFLQDNGVVVLSPDQQPAAGAGGARFGGGQILVIALGVGLAAILFVVGMALFGRLRGATGGGSGAGGMAKHNKVRASSRVKPPSVRFEDVAGADEAVEELSETVSFMRNPGRFAATGARMPRGIILYGPPGTGKTLLAKAVAGEAGVPFYAVSGSEFVESFVGVGASRVRDLFAQARKHKDGGVIFLDEIDAIGRKRGVGMSGADSERESTLNQLLVELDGFSAQERISVIAATNRLELLDDALLRPGRFDRHVQVSLPAERGRREILAVHAAGKPLADPSSLARVAAVTAGFSGADLAKLLNEAAIMAGRGGRTTISEEDLAEGMLRAVAGPERKDRALGAGELEKIAWHEAGHALAAELCPTHVKVQRVTILARGEAAGLALYGDTDSSLHSPQELHERMVVAMAGRAAEQLRFDAISSGAANDLEQVNRMARTAVERLGFSPEVGQIVTSIGSQPVALAEDTRQAIDAEVKRMVDSSYEEALVLLGAHRAELDALAGALLAHEQLNREEVEDVLEAITHPDGRRRPQQVKALPTDRQVPVSVDGEEDTEREREWLIRLRFPSLRPRIPVGSPRVALLRRRSPRRVERVR